MWRSRATSRPDIAGAAALGLLDADACRCCCSPAGRSSQSAWRDLRHAAHRHGRAGGAAASSITFGASTAATFDPDGAMGREVYFDSLTHVRLLPAGRARWLEQRLRDRTAGVAGSPGAPHARDASLRLTADGEFERVAVRRLARRRPDARAAGRGVPRRRHRDRGPDAVDEALLTGESRAVSRGRGDSRRGGQPQPDGRWSPCSVERTGADTRYAGIVATDGTRVGRAAAAGRSSPTASPARSCWAC